MIFYHIAPNLQGCDLMVKDVLRAHAVLLRLQSNENGLGMIYDYKHGQRHNYQFAHRGEGRGSGGKETLFQRPDGPQAVPLEVGAS